MDAEHVLALLKRIEWAGREGVEGDVDVCPECRSARPNTDEEKVHPHIGNEWYAKGYEIPVGHRADCELARLLETSR